MDYDEPITREDCNYFYMFRVTAGKQRELVHYIISPVLLSIYDETALQSTFYTKDQFFTICRTLKRGRMSKRRYITWRTSANFLRARVYIIDMEKKQSSKKLTLQKNRGEFAGDSQPGSVQAFTKRCITDSLQYFLGI